MRLLFLLRWSLRDLRHRWVQVVVIALIIAVGTGVYSGLGSTSTWRRVSNDASFAALGMYDLRVKASAGADAPRGAMLGALDGLPNRAAITDAEERLVVPSQVDASTADETILVPARIIGVDTSDNGPAINSVSVADGDGRAFTEGDRDVVILERNFASFYDLPPTGTVDVGGQPIDYIGMGLSPEYFFVMSEEGGLFAEANFAAVFTPLTTAQTLAGRPDRVNDLVIRVRPDADIAAIAEELQQAFDGSGLAVTVMQRTDEDAYRVLYDDIDNDQKFWNVFAALILAGAAFGAFNLASRMVEAERRQLGIGMALGASPARIALRPLLAGVEIAVLGVAFGIAMGLAFTAAIRPVFTELLPLPVWRTEFQAATFARGAVLGFVLPVVATAWPVWRAVRVLPVDAIATTHRTSRGGLSVLLRRLGHPTSTFARMPIGNVLRTPRRTLLTALGIAAAVTALVSTLGMIDSFVDTIDRNDREVLGAHPDRVTVTLQEYLFTRGSEITAIAADPTVGAVQPVLHVGARLSTDASGEPIDLLIDVIDLDGPVWSPTLVAGALPRDRSGLVVSAEAASDLDIGPGDQVVLEHPAFREGGLEMLQTDMRVVAVHPSPFRFSAFIDRSQLAVFGAPDVANQLFVVPAPGATSQDVQQAVFGMPGVASAQPVSAASKVVKDSLDDFVGVLRVLEVFIFLLALLIAYNATSISVDERAREHATLFAFGLPLRRVVRMDITESLLIGLTGTAVGVAAGLGVLSWFTRVLFADTMPELGIGVAVSPVTIVTAVVLGVLAVGAAPMLTVRRLRGMNIPATLRVVE
ncbi:MAG TPA: FtsX-like permease family protein [Ilumatobacteraceae bacterium]|nr:FtsX-like permease family protein [Ilumatobacteraceae bacterium]